MWADDFGDGEGMVDECEEENNGWWWPGPFCDQGL